MYAILKENSKVLIIESGDSYSNFLDTIQTFGLKSNESITVKMILKKGDYFKKDYIKITK